MWFVLRMYRRMFDLSTTLNRMVTTRIIKTDETDYRIKTDATQHNVYVCIDALDYVSHPDGALENIVTGQIAHLM